MSGEAGGGGGGQQSAPLSAAGSSLSLFSALGTSTVSGTSDSGGVNVDELSESRLEHAVEEARTSLRLLMLETLMFETYYDRLQSGQVNLTPAAAAAVAASAAGGGEAAGEQSRKGSTAQQSDSTASETDSQAATAASAASASLLDVSNSRGGGGGVAGGGALSRKRSGSRTSLGSRGKKSLRLTHEQKCGIASREVERIDHDLGQFRINSRRQHTNGVAEIDEKTLVLEEMEVSAAVLAKALSAALNRRPDGRPVVNRDLLSDGCREYSSDRLEEAFAAEEAAVSKHAVRLKNRNGVIASQIRRTLDRLRTDASAAEEGGPVDMDQLRLENSRSFDELQKRNDAVVSLRSAVTKTRGRRFSLQEKLKQEEKRGAQLQTDLKRMDRATSSLQKELPLLAAKVSKQESRARKLDSVRRSTEEEARAAPTVDEYFRVKVQQEKNREREKVAERRRYIQELEARVARQRERRATTTRARARSARGRMQQQQDQDYGSSNRGNLIRGATFNLEFRAPI